MDSQVSCPRNPPPLDDKRDVVWFAEEEHGRSIINFELAAKAVRTLARINAADKRKLLHCAEERRVTAYWAAAGDDAACCRRRWNCRQKSTTPLFALETFNTTKEA